MYETGDVLRPAILTYLDGRALTMAQVAAIRAYLRQWMAAPWAGPDIEELRRLVDTLTDDRAIDAWLERALKSGIDPL